MRDLITPRRWTVLLVCSAFLTGACFVFGFADSWSGTSGLAFALTVAGALLTTALWVYGRRRSMEEVKEFSNSALEIAVRAAVSSGPGGTVRVSVIRFWPNNRTEGFNLALAAFTPGEARFVWAEDLGWVESVYGNGTLKRLGQIKVAIHRRAAELRGADGTPSPSDFVDAVSNRPFQFLTLGDLVHEEDLDGLAKLALPMFYIGSPPTAGQP